MAARTAVRRFRKRRTVSYATFIGKSMISSF